MPVLLILKNLGAPLLLILKDCWKYIAIVVGILLIIFLIWRNGQQSATTNCEVQIQKQQIEVRDDTIKIIRRAKVITQNNNNLERDAIIDLL